MSVALDTVAYTDFARGVETTVTLLERTRSVVLPFAVLAEIRAGFALASRFATNEATLRRFLLRSGVTVGYPDDQTTQQYAALFRQLKKQGTPIPTNDMWIAALVLQHNLTLHSRDAHFDHLPQIVRV